MTVQIDENHRAIVESILGIYANDAWVFGSRAKHKAGRLADLDLLLRLNLSREVLAGLREKFEESDLPYKVDLVLASDLEPEFFDQIKSDLVKFQP